MNREQAEKLLAALIFDDLDEPSRAELLAYLQTDDELRDRLADMRMAAKLACDAVNDGPDPVLSAHRLKDLQRLTETRTRGVRIFTAGRVVAVAAVLMLGLVFMATVVTNFGGTKRAGRAGLVWRKPAASSLALPDAQSTPSGTMYNMETDQDRFASAPRSGGMGGGMASETMNGFRAGGTGGAGGYGGGMMGGMGSEGSRNRPLARSGYSPGDRESVDDYAVAADERLGGRGGRSSSSRDVMDLKSEPLAQLGPESQTLDELSTSGGGIRSLFEAGTSQRVPTSESTTREADGDRFGQSLSYGWSGPLTPGQPASPMQRGAATEFARPSAELPAVVPDSVNGPVATDKSVPTLGDVPVVGELFRRESEIKEDLGFKEKESNEGRGWREEFFLAPADAPVAVNADDGESLGGAAVREQMAELNTALPPFESRFRAVPVNPWVMTESDPLSTFALDVDTASYALCRRYIRNGFLPPVGAVRMEEFLNAFDYAYPQRDDATFAVYAEGAPSPFAPAGQDLRLVKIAVKARTVGRDQRRPAHIVFVIDASASMGQADRLPQVQAALNLLVDKLFEDDRISLVTCADQARLHLEAVPARERERIRQTIDAIQPAGPTNLLAGLKVGYEMARRAFAAGRINQVVLCSDGVANVGRTEAEDVLAAVANDRVQGITLTCVGVGYGAYNDAFLEALANRGDGRYVFLDSSEQAREDLVGQLAATLQTVARDARIQVRFNPQRVRRYRLIGYENRDIEDRRFRDDTVDAGEVGSGQCSTALYEVELTGSSSGEGDGELGTVSVRYRNAETGQMEEIARSLAASIVRRQTIAENPRFFLAAGVARFAEWLRQSEHARHTTPADIQDVLDRVSAVLSLDRTVRDLAALVHQAENLPRASEATIQP